jgi:hypothetical protein
MVEDPVELGYPGWGSGSISERDWNALKKIISDYDVRTVVEFGIGLSTLMMMQLCKIDGYDNLQRHIDWMQTKVNDNVTLNKWDGKTPVVLNKFYDMAFVDGPNGAMNRIPSVKSVLHNCRVFAMHDIGYVWNDKWRHELDTDRCFKCVHPGGRFSVWTLQ